MIKRIISTVLILCMCLVITSPVVEAKKFEINKVNAKITQGFEINPVSNKIEKVKFAEMDADDLRIGENEIYNDGETVISLKIEKPELMIRPMAGGDSGWSVGVIGDTATLYPNKSTPLTDLSYEVFWYNYAIDYADYLDYRVGLGTVTSSGARVVRATANNVANASAIGEVNYVVTQNGLVVGSYNNWLRIDINNSGQVRTAWNY